MKFHPTLYNGCDYLSLLGLSQSMVVKGAIGRQLSTNKHPLFPILVSAREYANTTLSAQTNWTATCKWPGINWLGLSDSWKIQHTMLTSVLMASFVYNHTPVYQRYVGSLALLQLFAYYNIDISRSITTRYNTTITKFECWSELKLTKETSWASYGASCVGPWEKYDRDISKVHYHCTLQNPTYQTHSNISNA